MPADEIASEFVIGAIGEDELDFVVGVEGFEIRLAKTIRGAGMRALYVHNLHDFRGNFVQWSLAAGLEQNFEAASHQALHQGHDFTFLQHGFAAGDFDQFAIGRAKSLDFGLNVFCGHFLAAGEGVLAVAPGAAQIAGCQPNEDAGKSGVGRFTLQRLVNFRDLHGEG